MDNQSGNVFFYIFLCIGLLAALSFAVSQGGRGAGGKLSDDRRRLIATEMISFGDTMAKTVTQLRLRGTAETQLSFAHSFLSTGYGTPGSAPANEVFNPAGGAAVYNHPPADGFESPQPYRFLANNMVENVGSTCATSDCIDLVMAAVDVKEEVCAKINELLGNSAGTIPSDTGIDDATLYAAGADPFGAGSPETIGDEDIELEGRSEGCFEDATNIFVYFKVLMAR